MVSVALKIERAKDAVCRLFGSQRGDLEVINKNNMIIRIINRKLMCWADYDITGPRVQKLAHFDSRQSACK